MGGRVNWWMVLLAAGLLGLLAFLAMHINDHRVAGLDVFLEDWFDAHRTRRREAAASGIFGYIGRPEHVAIVALAFGAPLSLLLRSALPLVCVMGSVGVGVAAEEVLKAVIGRTAGTGPLVEYPHSFPSGHVMGTTVVLGTIAVCLGVRANGFVRELLVVVVMAGVAAVSFLALFTGAHTFSDVIGGILLGGALVALTAAVVHS